MGGLTLAGLLQFTPDWGERLHLSGGLRALQLSDQYGGTVVKKVTLCEVTEYIVTSC